MRTLLVVFILLFSISLHSQKQDTVNQSDANGKKQGFWRKKDKNGKTIYEGQFKDNLPYGDFKYFYPEGGIKAKTKVTKNGSRVFTTTYFRNGKKNAEGIFVNEKRDSTWRFFSEVDETLVSEEFYKAGKKEGKSINYYPGQGKAEMITWKDNVKEGPWETYYPEGNVKLKCAYKNDQKNGPIQVHYLTGKTMLTGQYLNGTPVGTWVYFKEKGGITKKETYERGMVVKVDSTMNVK
jgi:antitoxin component YwqK of YwqJK toxin-antitoxin module